MVSPPQTSGAGFAIFTPSAVTQFSFVGNNDTDGPYFNGTLSPAVSAVPLPASATVAWAQVCWPSSLP